MRELNAYIIEKLKLNKDIKMTDSNMKLNVPKDEDYKFLKTLSIDDITNMDEVRKKCKYCTKMERYWIALMQLTDSRPFIYNGEIYSYPGNFGRHLLDNMLKNGFDIDDTYFQYDMQKDNEIHDTYGIIKSVKDYYKHMVNDNLLRYVDENLNIKLKDFDDSNYTEKAKEIIRKRNGIIILPLELSMNSKSVDAELGFIGSSYYHYSVNGKKCYTFQDFTDEIKKQLKV